MMHIYLTGGIWCSTDASNYIGIPGFDVVSTAVEWKNFVQQVALSTGSDYTVPSSACFLAFLLVPEKSAVVFTTR